MNELLILFGVLMWVGGFCCGVGLGMNVGNIDIGYKWRQHKLDKEYERKLKAK